LYDKIKLGCVPNLLISVLINSGYDIAPIGAMWPWEFILYEESTPDDPWDTYPVKLVKCVTGDTLSLLYGISVKSMYFSDAGDIISAMSKHMQEGKRCIVAADSYYTPYMYKHVYQHRHWAHATMPLWFDEANSQVYICSADPPYQGNVLLKDFYTMVEKSNVYWLMTISVPPMPKTLDDKFVHEMFHKQLQKTYDNYFVLEGHCKNVNYSDDLCNTWAKLREIKDTGEQLKSFKELLKGDAGYYVHRKGQLLIEYLSTDYVRTLLQSPEEYIELVEQQNRLWKTVYNILYLAEGRNRIGDSLDKAINKMSLIIENEKTLLEKILHSMRRLAC